MSKLGLGVMIGMLGGNEETVNAVKASLGKEIKSITLEGDNFKFVFSDNSTLNIWDGGQSCCEHRYMVTDDNLESFVGDTLVNMEIVQAPDSEDQYGNTHEVQFLNVITNKGTFQMANHNEHNGYYGGFLIQANNR